MVYRSNASKGNSRSDIKRLYKTKLQHPILSPNSFTRTFVSPAICIAIGYAETSQLSDYFDKVTPSPFHSLSCGTFAKYGFSKLRCSVRDNDRFRRQSSVGPACWVGPGCLGSQDRRPNQAAPLISPHHAGRRRGHPHATHTGSYRSARSLKPVVTLETGFVQWRQRYSVEPKVHSTLSDSCSVPFWNWTWSFSDNGGQVVQCW